MRKLLETCEKYNTWALFLLLWVLFIFEFIYRVGIIDTVGFSQAFAQIITIFLLFVILVSMGVALIKKKTDYLKLTGTGLLAYYSVTIVLSFPQTFILFESNDWSLILSGTFMLISLILIVLVVSFYLLSVFFNKYHFLNNAAIFLIGGNVIFSFLALTMNIIALSKNGDVWYSYFYVMIKYGIAPLLTFFGILYLFPKVNALGGNELIEAQIIEVKENDKEE